METVLSKKEAKVLYHFITDIFDGDISTFRYYCFEEKIDMDVMLNKLEFSI